MRHLALVDEGPHLGLEARDAGVDSLHVELKAVDGVGRPTHHPHALEREGLAWRVAGHVPAAGDVGEAEG